MTLGPSHRERLLQLLSPELDWDFIHHLAQRHRLAPLLYAHLNDLGAGVVPRPILVDWWRRHEHHARRNRELAQKLSAVARALEQHGIPCVPYKGPLLAESLYGSLSLRAFDDIDLLIRRRDVDRAKTVLEAEGYRPYYTLGPAVRSAMIDSRLQYHLIYAHDRPEHLLEVHWKTDPAFPVEEDSDAWWQGLDRVTFMGERVRAFSAEAQLLMSCVHAMRHHGYRLSWLVDVAEALRQPRALDWAWTIDRARAIGAWRRLAVALKVAHAVLDAPVPAEVLARVNADPPSAKLADRVARRLFVRDAGDLATAERLRLDLRLFDRTSDRLRHLLSVMFEPSFHEWTAWPLPRPLYPLYLPFRVARLAAKYAATRSWRGARTARGARADDEAGRE